MARPRTGEKTRSTSRKIRMPQLGDELTTEKVAATTAYRRALSSGLFGLPQSAAAVDWMVLNSSPHPQTFRVTVYRAGVGPRVEVAPGALTLTLDPDEVTHNANSVGPGAPFEPGFYYELLVEANSRRVLPSIHVWQDNGNTVLAGTLIPPGSFVEV